MKLLFFNNLSDHFRKRISRSKQLDPILGAGEILGSNPKKLNSIFLSSGIADYHYDSLYRHPIERTAELLQLLPGPEKGKYDHPGGMIAHVLDACAIALKYRKGVNLPIGAPPEERAQKRDLYTYAVFVAALLKPVGGALYRQQPALHDWRGQHLCEWNPVLEEISRHRKARFMKAGFRQDATDWHRPLESLLYAARILPRDGLLWLRSDPGVYGQFLDALSDAPRGPIHELVRKAYRASADPKAKVGAGEERQHIRRTESRSIQQGDNEVAPETPQPPEAWEVRTGKPKSGTSSPARKRPEKTPAETEAKPPPEKSPAILPNNPVDGTLTSQGERFRSWLEDLINDSGANLNKIDGLVHSLDEGIFVVAPDIFQVFAERDSTRYDLVQTEFANLGIHLKNPNGDDPARWRIRFKADGRTSFKTGWIVPAGYLHLKNDLAVNENAVLMNK